jgi:capsular polysaccharide biosynthesis protein
MNDFFDNRRIFDIIWARRIHFVIVGVVAVLISAIFSGPAFITPRYKATARLYPVNLSVLSEESETEQMLEILNSTDIKLKMFDAFRLDEVYKIRKDDPLYLTNMFGVYNKNFSARKTEFETVEIEVLDRDPVRAYQMCDSVIRLYHLKVRELHSAKHWEMVRIAENSLRSHKRERDSVVALINQYRKEYQILDFDQQVPEVTRGYMKALAEGRENTPGGREIRKLYDNLVDKGAETYMLDVHFTMLNNSIDSIKRLYQLHSSEAQKVITYGLVVDNPVVPDKKAYPIRWLIVALSLFSSLFLALLVFMILDFKGITR